MQTTNILGEASIESKNVGYQINTNLEQISDWLTKILIGIGLVQLGELEGWINTFSIEVGGDFGGGGSSRVFIIGLLTYFSVIGFLIGYLWTRLSFGIAVQRADNRLLARKIGQLEADAMAFAMTLGHLSVGTARVAVSQEKLNQALKRRHKMPGEGSSMTLSVLGATPNVGQVR